MKYVKISDDGYMLYSVESTIEQPDLIEIDFDIPPCPEKGYRFKLSTRTWEPGDEQQTFNIAVLSVNSVRLDLLNQSDWTDTLSAKVRLGDDLYNQWQTYRQALRDITSQPGYPLNIEWPTAPGRN